MIRTISIDTEAEEDNKFETISSEVESTEKTLEEDDSIIVSVNDLKLDSDISVDSSRIGSHSANEKIEVPYVDVTLNSTLPQDYLKEDILNTIQSLKIPNWYVRGSFQLSPLDRNLLKLTKITGAMTNVIYKVEYPSLPSLLLRVYGHNNDSIIDRDYELEVLARLSVRNIGPSLYGCFENGRFEQYLDNAQTLGKKDIRDWKTSQRIARRMKELHTGVPLLNSEREAGPASWAKINDWIKRIETKGRGWVNDDGNIKDVLLCNSWEGFKTAVEQYRGWLYGQNSSKVKSTLVFCHNDAQYGNLIFTSPVIKADNPIQSTLKSSSSTSLFPQNSNISLEQIINPPIQDQSQDSKLVVIDFEYAGANPAAYDLANHLSEWMHDYNCSEPFRCNPMNFPTKEQMLNFIYSYVSHLRRNSNLSIDDEVKYYYNAILRWRGTVQLFWCLWAILQSGNLQDEALERTESHGPSGHKYIIKTEVSDGPDDSEPSSDEPEGVDIDSFDYLAYCREKIALFWGDVIQFGVVPETECVPSQARKLDTNTL